MIEMIILLSVVIAMIIAVYVAPTTSNSLNTPVVKKADKSIKIPEDSMLKRHFLANLQAEIESNFHSRPTDASLKRHYDSLIISEMDKYIQLNVA
ncbi:MAG: hypothetical protein Q9M50_14390 [Methylococcales bacterium]|nr:hypothetical protein [Methylococcales bacterium]